MQSYLGGGETLLGQLVDLFLDLTAGQLQPGGDGSPVGEGTLGDTLAWCVHATHLDELNALKRNRVVKHDRSKSFRVLI